MAEVFRNETTNQNHFKMICSSTTAFMRCNVEILVNNKTFDDIRSVNGTCLCLEGSCSNNGICSRFIWYYINKNDMVNSSIGCAGKFENLTLKTVYRVSSSGIFNGTGKFRYVISKSILSRRCCVIEIILHIHLLVLQLN